MENNLKKAIKLLTDHITSLETFKMQCWEDSKYSVCRNKSLSLRSCNYSGNCPHTLRKNIDKLLK